MAWANFRNDLRQGFWVSVKAPQCFSFLLKYLSDIRDTVNYKEVMKQYPLSFDAVVHSIRIACPCSGYLLIPHFYIVKVGLLG